MQSSSLPMPLEAFHRMPRRIGWKYEYWDGKARVSPRQHVVTVRLDLPAFVSSSAKLSAWVPCAVRPASSADREALVEGFAEAFERSAEFCDWSADRFFARAEACVEDFFSGQRGEPMAASRVAVDADGRPVGASLVRLTDAQPPLLDLLFVRPAWQRLGLASALVRSAAEALFDRSYEAFFSQYFLCNEESSAWHQAFGFTEVPDLMLARLRLRHAQHDAARHDADALDARAGALHRKAEEEVARRQEEVDRLEAKADAEGFEAVVPRLW